MFYSLQYCKHKPSINNKLLCSLQHCKHKLSLIRKMFYSIQYCKHKLFIIGKMFFSLQYCKHKLSMIDKMLCSIQYCKHKLPLIGKMFRIFSLQFCKHNLSMIGKFWNKDIIIHLRIALDLMPPCMFSTVDFVNKFYDRSICFFRGFNVSSHVFHESQNERYCTPTKLYLIAQRHHGGNYSEHD